MELMTGLGAAFGLSSSAGLNAYIPLLIVALAARFPSQSPLIQLGERYDPLTSWWVIGLLAILLMVELLVDKIPAVDTVNDVIQTAVRPAAGALLFAANTNAITDMNVVLAAVAGILVAGTVHTTKGVARPVVTASTGGMGNWLVSLLEDIVAFTASIMAIFVPTIIGTLVVIALIFAIRFVWRRRRRNRLSTV